MCPPLAPLTTVVSARVDRRVVALERGRKVAEVRTVAGSRLPEPAIQRHGLTLAYHPAEGLRQIVELPERGVLLEARPHAAPLRRARSVGGRTISYASCFADGSCMPRGVFVLRPGPPWAWIHLATSECVPVNPCLRISCHKRV